MEATIAGAQSELVDDLFAAPADAEPIGTIRDAGGRELWLYADGSSTLVEADDLFADVENSEPVGSFEDSDGRVMCVYADGSYSAERKGEVLAK